jgi:hypothetical protein
MCNGFHNLLETPSRNSFKKHMRGWSKVVSTRLPKSPRNWKKLELYCTASSSTHIDARKIGGSHSMFSSVFSLLPGSHNGTYPCDAWRRRRRGSTAWPDATSLARSFIGDMAGEATSSAAYARRPSRTMSFRYVALSDVRSFTVVCARSVEAHEFEHVEPDSSQPVLARSMRRMRMGSSGASPLLASPPPSRGWC